MNKTAFVKLPLVICLQAAMAMTAAAAESEPRQCDSQDECEHDRGALTQSNTLLPRTLGGNTEGVQHSVGQSLNGSAECGLTAPMTYSASEPLFRVTVDGAEVTRSEMSGASELASANASPVDRQRCTDVALAAHQVQFRFDSLAVAPRLAVASGWQRESDDSLKLQVSGYSNYHALIERAELVLYTLQGERPARVFHTLPLDKTLSAQWQPGMEESELPEQLGYQLRVYDHKGRYDETALRVLITQERDEPIASEYGNNHLERQTIPVRGGTLTVNGQVPADTQNVRFMGETVPLDAEGRFVAQALVESGQQQGKILITDAEGQTRRYQRPVQLPTSDWFSVGMADLTVGSNSLSGDGSSLSDEDREHYDDDLYSRGRIAFYTKGKLSDRYTLTASMDSREEDLSDVLSRLDEKDPRHQLRRIEEENHYAEYGDDSIVTEDAPTQGRLYVKLEDQRSHALWGNFTTDINDTELARIDRSLYGAQLQWNSEQSTGFAEPRTQVDLFIAEAGTQSAYEEFLGTGGSLYYLQHQDITQGSEQLVVETRDKVSGLVMSRRTLVAGADYDIDSSQGRVLLNSPLSSSANDDLVVRDGSLPGNDVFLIVQYEYTGIGESLNNLANGGRISHWLTDSVRLGITGSDQTHTGFEQTLGAADLLLRHSDNTWLTVEFAQTDGPGYGASGSYDGGYGFSSQSIGNSTHNNSGENADGWRVESTVAFSDIGWDNDGDLRFYTEQREEGFSSTGRLTDTDTDQMGVDVRVPLSQASSVRLKIDDIEKTDESEQTAAEINWIQKLTEQWALTGGVRLDERRTLNSESDQQGDRTDATVQLDYKANEDWGLYGFVQGTLEHDDQRERNNRAGLGGSYAINDHYRLNAEVSDGNLGFGALIGGEYQYGSNGSIYLNYELDPDFSGFSSEGRNGQLVSGVRHRYSDSTSVYSEMRHLSGAETGLTQMYGVDFDPSSQWSFGVSYEQGRISRDNSAGIERDAVAVSAGYLGESGKAGTSLEYRDDQSDSGDRTSWLMRNNLSLQMSDDWRLQARYDFAISDSGENRSQNSDFTEGLIGIAYRPATSDRFNGLISLHHLEDLAPAEQYSSSGNQNTWQQRSNIITFDGNYDLTHRWTIGARYALRRSEIRQGREQGEWLDSDAELMIVRLDWHLVRHWDVLLEARSLDVEAADDRRTGALVAVHRHLGDHYKLGVGYNFTEFSDDLTEHDFKAKGWFANLVAKF